MKLGLYNFSKSFCPFVNELMTHFCALHINELLTYFCKRTIESYHITFNGTNWVPLTHRFHNGIKRINGNQQ